MKINIKKKRRKEYYIMIPIEIVTEDIDESMCNESMFDAGFGNVRLKVANALGDDWTVTNVTKFMDNKNDCFMVVDNDDKNHFFKFISTGTGIKCPGYFTNASLSMALKRILDTVLNN